MESAYYHNDAFDSSRPRQIPPGNIKKLGFAWRHALRNPLNLPVGVQCGEQLANKGEVYALEWLNSGKNQVDETLKEPFQEIQYWETLHNPKVALNMFTQVILIFTILFIICYFLIIFLGLFLNPAKLTNSEFHITLICIAISPLPFYLVGRVLLRSNRIKDKNNILFNRRKGTVTIPRKKNAPLDFPFDEFDPYIGTSVNPSGSVDYHLILAHRYTGSFVQHPGGTREELNVYLQWEYMQQYMDISKPLPDVPSMEPFRAKDPVTADYDLKHNRPPRYWRDMDIEQARRMKEASAKAASNFPWGMTREQALARGWQPSGFGEGDWKKTC